MRPIRHKRWLALPAALVLTGALGGCHLARTQYTNPMDAVQTHTFFHENYRNKRTVIRSQAETITVVHAVAFKDGSSEPADGAFAALAEFLDDNGAREGARLEIDGPRLDGGHHDALTSARLKAIQDELARQGLSGHIPERSTALLTKPAEVTTVTLNRAMAILPDCSNHQPPDSERVDYAWTCANGAALGMMVADPLDLERGRALGPADASASVLGIQRYRAGKVGKAE